MTNGYEVGDHPPIDGKALPFYKEASSRPRSKGSLFLTSSYQIPVPKVSQLFLNFYCTYTAINVVQTQETPRF